MDWKCHVLKECGYDIVWTNGHYCRACRDNRDVLLRWNGEIWTVV